MITTFRNTLVLGSLLVASALFGVDRSALAEEAPTLYSRLGQWDGIHQIVRDTIANHRKNPAIAHFFDGVDDDQLAAHVTAFFAAGTGGPNKYEGRDMTSTHASMGLSNDDFDKAVADVLLALDMNDIGDAEKSEVATILESLRPAVMGTGG
jgi:hemoglobin